MAVPTGSGTYRRDAAFATRVSAATVARERHHPAHVTNGEEFEYRAFFHSLDHHSSGRGGRHHRGSGGPNNGGHSHGGPHHHTGDESHDGRGVQGPSHVASFTKGLPHDLTTGLIKDPADFRAFVRAIDSGLPRDFVDVPLGGCFHHPPPGGVRAWESAAAGLTFDLQGPDAQALTMPPAPRLDSAELAAEMVEVYAMALARDVPFAEWAAAPPPIAAAVRELNDARWHSDAYSDRSLGLSPAAAARRRVTRFTPQSVFRGVGRGVGDGPYVSQFLLLGNAGVGGTSGAATDGFVTYGANRVDLRVPIAAPGVDYLTTWEAFVDVQNGADTRGMDKFVHAADGTKTRFIATPRDLATYVHFDALYQAYLNACLWLLAEGVPFDGGLPWTAPDAVDHQQGFATFGGPHVLSLLTEVATRALKAVRYQKFNVHRRLRPEAVGGLLDRLPLAPEPLAPVASLAAEVAPTLRRVAAANEAAVAHARDDPHPRNVLLPMAYPEGSPMHPSYGAGHATVAGACVTVLKGWFDASHALGTSAVEATPDGGCLRRVSTGGAVLTVEGELNKLASNISIGRNWAGVHYYSDYIESVRLGEAVALGILEEQKLTYGENWSMTVPLTDGTTVRI
ncbi:hypothetical protein MMPV_006588 [Pyropia vietnamensis]